MIMNGDHTYCVLGAINSIITFGIKGDADLKPQKYIDFD